MRALGLALLLGTGCLFHHTRPPEIRARPAEEARADPAGSLRVWWIGHATVLVKMGDRWLLTDPVFSRRVGTFVKRHVEPGVAPEALPPVDVAVISHAHADHLDFPSLERLRAQTVLAVPPGVLTYLPDDLPTRRIASLGVWESVDLDGMRITAVPAQHSDGRWQIDALWNHRAHTGWVVEYQGMTVFFAGDTGYDAEAFRAIGRRFRIDLALIPVGPVSRLGGNFFMRRVHVSPREAMRVFADVKAAFMVPIHYGTFFRGSSGEKREVMAAIAESPLRHKVLALEIGESALLYPPAALTAASP
jgi:L-ascorbate metabolism protein UlaG (beta-lactamase superfamily)